MCSEKDERAVSALKSLNHPQIVRIPGQNGPPVARLFCKNKFEYLMRKTRVTVGRTSARNASADVDMGSSTYISRNHLEIYMTESRFFVLVTGKNGVFINGAFHRKDSAPLELQHYTLLRFPSTDITIQFHILLEEELLAPIKCPPLPLAEEPIHIKKENNLSNGTHKSNSPAGGHPVVESPVPVAMTAEVKQEVIPVSIIKSEEVVTKPRNREPVAKELKVVGSEDKTKPPFSYAQLIVQAISAQKDKQLTLSGIYAYISKKYPYYQSHEKGWQNSIRHNLSLNRYFIKVPRAQEESGKGSFWRIDPDSEASLMDSAFRKRRQRPTPSSMSHKTTHGDATPSLASMSSVETDGIGTPEDSVLSWEGGAMTEETTNEHMVSEEVAPQPIIYQGNGTASYESQRNQTIEAEPLHQVTAFTHHTLPQLVTKPQFFIAKPPGMSAGFSHFPGVVPVQLPATMAGTAANSAARSNDLELRDSARENKVFMVPDKPPSFMSYLQRPPVAMQSFHPKTVIVRMNSNSAISGASAVGGQLVRFAFGVPAATAIEAQNVLSAAAAKVEVEEMETEESVSSVEAAGYVMYDSTSSASEAINGERNNCIQLRTISN